MDDDRSLTFRRFKDGETHGGSNPAERILRRDTRLACPTGIHRTPPRQDGRDRQAVAQIAGIDAVGRDVDGDNGRCIGALSAPAYARAVTSRWGAASNQHLRAPSQ